MNGAYLYNLYNHLSEISYVYSAQISRTQLLVFVDYLLNVGYLDAHKQLFIANEDSFQKDFVLQLLADFEQISEALDC